MSGETVELLRTLVQNACVNDGTPESGQEVRNADTLAAFLDGLGLHMMRFEPLPGRTSLVARLEGADPNAPSLCLMGHTDVVPAHGEHWSVDPFAAEIIDGAIWGRGCVDMLHQTAAQAAALARLARSGFRPRGDLVFFAPADEEAGGAHGTAWIVENEPDAVNCDYVLTEGGGFVLPSFGDGRAGPVIGVMVGEKGSAWRRLSFSGTPGHGAIPYRADNALLKAARAVLRLSRHESPAQISAVWRALVARMHIPDDLQQALVDPRLVDDAISGLATERPLEAKIFHACTHNTFSVNAATAGTKVNVIAGEATLHLDARLLPGVSVEDFDAELRRALGDLYDEVVISDVMTHVATESPFDTPLWPVLETAAREIAGPCRLAPWTTPFATDARFFRRVGVVGYGFTLHDETMDLGTWLRMFHGDDEHVSVRAVEAATAVYERIARDFLA